MACFCQIIPDEVLKRFSNDPRLTAEQRRHFANAARIGTEIRKLRKQAGKLTAVTASMGLVAGVVPATPAITLSDCQHNQTLPGIPVADPANSADGTTKRAFVETNAVAEFYRSVFGRNSIDGAGITNTSSVHYGTNFNNAFWNGSRMTYGDGDNNIFIDFTNSTDVIAHELTHGVTQYSLQLSYTSQAGGLNEHMSDAFGSMFRQWRANQDVTQADWLIGKEIIGPGAAERGFTCLRDLASPGAAHCLTPQPFHFSDFQTGMDPHISSGIPNLAFYTAAKAVGGKSWETVGQIWYNALTGPAPNPNMTMKTFANRTRQLAAQVNPANAAVANAIDAGWTTVGL